MALSHGWLKNAARLFWIFLLVMGESICKKTNVFYMEEPYCGNVEYIGGATVYSHKNQGHRQYKNGVGCKITFRAENAEWRIMLKVLELDLPDISYGDICNDALYIYDSEGIRGAFKEAGGNGGLCGTTPPPVIYSSKSILTIYFRTDGQNRGKGFKLVVTSFSDDFDSFRSCGNNFQCKNNKCISKYLTCDKVDHCFDKSDEGNQAQCFGVTSGGSKGNQSEENIVDKFLSLGVTAAVVISVGSVLVFVVCVVIVTCCCCKWYKRKQEREAEQRAVTTATAVTRQGSQPYPMEFSGPKTSFANTSYVQQGYHPMHQQQISAYPAYPPNKQMYPPNQQTQMYTQNPPQQVGVYSPYGQSRECFSSSQDSSTGYSSQLPRGSHTRSYTPTSSRSNKSNSDVTYNGNTEKVTMPVHL